MLAISSTTWLLLGGGALVLWLVWTWNVLVRRKNRVREAFSGVDVQLKRRHDLVPNLVKVVKGYATHERETLEAVVEARDAAHDAEALPDRAARETGLSQSLGKLFALVEAYPQLKSDENFRRLHADLVEIEDALQYARRYYNGTVRDLNNTIEQFPSNVVAGMSGRQVEPFFEIEDHAERRLPSVELDGEEA